MHVFEVTSLPETAGKAKLNWVDPTRYQSELPSRKGNVITLPLVRIFSLFLLNGGEQFLFVGRTYIDRAFERNNRETDYESLFFGGTDENPFLVRLFPDSVRSRSHKHNASDLVVLLGTRGEEAFFRQLRPRGLDSLEDRLKVKAKRQGDVFALPLGYDLETLTMASMVYLDNPQHEFEKVEEMPVFETRHRLKGFHSPKVVVGNQAYEVAQGVITAPDHSNLVLDEPHALFQTEGLWDPKKAD